MKFKITTDNPNDDYVLMEFNFDLDYLRLDDSVAIKNCIEKIVESIKNKTFPNLIVDFKECRD